MNNMNFVMSVLDQHASKHRITAISKEKVGYNLFLTLDNGKVISLDERLITIKDFIQCDDDYVVYVTRE